MQKNIRKLLSIGLTAAALAVSTFASASTDLSGKSWREIEELAKKEGKLTVSVWYLQPQFRNFVKEFENQYGIKVKVPEGTLDGNINKLIAEKNLETGKMDVVVLNADRLGNVAKNDILVKLNNLPNFDKLNHHLQGVELGDMAVGYWGNQTGLAYDPMRIKEEEANWKKTWDWFSSKKDALIRTASNADSLTRLNDGELVIVSAWQDHLFSLQKQGAITDRLKFYVPKFGMPGGGNVVTVAKNAPNPAASLVFVHWITSPEVQQKLNQEFGVRPLNSESGLKDTIFFSTPWRKAEMEAFTKEVISR
ncbi:MAG: extracellular solute-binding protein [Haemophilus parainfluenzae]|nr:extracellular solute-binding protein [Haemophilus parainfluenzae]